MYLLNKNGVDFMLSRKYFYKIMIIDDATSHAD